MELQQTISLSYPVWLYHVLHIMTSSRSNIAICQRHSSLVTYSIQFSDYILNKYMIPNPHWNIMQTYKSK